MKSAMTSLTKKTIKEGYARTSFLLLAEPPRILGFFIIFINHTVNFMRPMWENFDLSSCRNLN